MRGSVPKVEWSGRVVRFIRLFWLPKQPVPPKGTRQRAEYDALQIAAFGWPENRPMVRFVFRSQMCVLWVLIVISSYASPHPQGLLMWLVRLGATAVFFGMVWRWLR